MLKEGENDLYVRVCPGRWRAGDLVTHGDGGGAHIINLTH